MFDDESVGIEQENGTADKLLPISNVMVRRDPEWIRKVIVENRPYKLPIFINTEVFEGVVTDHIYEDWLKRVAFVALSGHSGHS